MYYFASDMHLGLSGCGDPRDRERLLVRWLEEVSNDAEAIFLVGDVFDFWFEYKRVVPKGFTRLLGKFSELTDRGVKIYFFSGNHDMWAYDYLQTECGVEVCHEPRLMELSGKQVFIAHGDNMYIHAPFGERVMSMVFHSPFIRRMFAAWVHPNCAMRFGQWWSSKSRKSKEIAHPFGGEEEFLVRYARKYLEEHSVDYFVFGHIHCAEDYELGDGVHALFLGEWLERPAYAVLNAEGQMSLRFYPDSEANEKR